MIYYAVNNSQQPTANDMMKLLSDAKTPHQYIIINNNSCFKTAQLASYDISQPPAASVVVAH
jgi:hypothetical protein